MESSEPREPSYYEVALTNRQVLVAFVVLLTCLLAAFLSGVWIGRGAAPPRSARVAAAPATPPAAAPIEQLTFFSDKAPGKGAPAKGAAPSPAPAGKPAATPPADSAADTMARTLEAEMAKSREGAAATAGAPADGKATASPPAAVPLTPGARTTQKPAPAMTAPAAKPAAESAAASTAAKPSAAPPAAVPAGSVWIQVYSSTNGERAKQIAASLRKAKYSVLLAEIPKSGQATWRVRVGPYETRAKADAAAAKLRREQKLDTWVTDTP